MFKHREDAGKKLGKKLMEFKDNSTIVLAIPRGGVEVGANVARIINADFSLIISRKLPFPDNPESGFGAIAEDGSIFLHEKASRWLEKDKINNIISKQKREIDRRKKILRSNTTFPNINDKKVILVDDGIAMGSTMIASIKMCKKRNPNKIVVASPVSGTVVAEKINDLVDKTVILEKPTFFRAVAQVYENWYDVSDEEVIDILNKFRIE